MPIGIAANGRDELFVADRQARKILKLASDGRVIATYGGQSSKNMGLSHPEAVAVGTDKLFVVDTGNKTVQVSQRGSKELVHVCGTMCKPFYLRTYVHGI